MDVQQQKAIKEFKTEFSQKVNDTISSIEMVCISADDKTFAALQLENVSVAHELWGLLVFCEHGLYFYVHPYESLMGMMIRQAAHAKAPTEQLLSIHTLQNLHVTFHEKKWYEIFTSSFGKKIQLDFTAPDGNSYTAFMQCQNNPSSVFNKILQFQQILQAQ